MLKEIFSNIYIFTPIVGLTAFLLVLFIIPKISWIVYSKNLMERPNFRSSHKTVTPSLGGTSFFITLVVIALGLKNWDLDSISLHWIASVTIIFALGLKDDLVYSSPRAKLKGEIVASVLVILCSCMEVVTLNGFLGIHDLPVYVSYPILLFLFLAIINAYNLIDGIDGLASTIAIVIFSIYALIFYGVGEYYYFLLCIALLGVQVAYLRYNLSHTQKIFMGDTGSLFIGFWIAFFSVRFLAMDAVQISTFSFLPENRLLIVAAIICIPIFDICRVIGIRLLNRQSPFEADRNHIHHLIIDSGFTHVQASTLLGFINYIIVVGILILAKSLNSIQLLLIMLSFYGLVLVLLYRLKKNLTLRVSNKN